MTCRHVQIQKTLPHRKLTNCKRCIKETLINNSLTGKELFYRLNEQFVSNRARDIIFYNKRSYWRAADKKHFAIDLPTHADTQNFSRRKNF